MVYEDWVRITRGSATTGTTAVATGAYTPDRAGETVLYDGPADIQDSRQRPRDTEGRVLGFLPATVFLPEFADDKLASLQPDDRLEGAYGPQRSPTRKGTIDIIRPMDAALLVRWAT